ncbi:MAG: ATPase, T2SS/T4P/T4SS family [Planctomycetota bacterium]
MVRLGEFCAVSVVDELLQRAHAWGATDIHLDPGANRLAVTFRRDGVLEEQEPLPGDATARVVGRLKTLADLLAYRTDLPQEGRVPADRTPFGRELRVATFPTIDGERVAVRLDARDVAPEGLEALGLPGRVLRPLRDALDQPEGVVLLTGPSGSGKTTTLYACLRHLLAQHPRRAIVSIEDPVERRIEGVAQCEVHEASGLDFACALRSVLRQDPDVILVGEIRDRETAAAALEAGLTGHLVLSTIHAGTAPRVFARLLDMGMEPFVLTSAIRGVLAQRLVRLRADEGYEGRAPVAQWANVGDALRRGVLDRLDATALEAAAARDGARTLHAAAQALVRAGYTTKEEVQRVLGRDG